MNRSLKWFAVLATALTLAWGSFYGYSKFLLDYSLTHLEKTLSVTAAQINRPVQSPVAQKAYKQLVQDLALAEVRKDRPDLQDIILMDAASRSLEEAEERVGFRRAQVYLSQIAQEKKKNRNPLLLQMDGLYLQAANFFESIQNSISSAGKKKTAKKKVDYAGVFLLTQAEAKLQAGSLKDAIEIYEKYLKGYKNDPDRGYVMVSLAHALIRINDFAQAEQILLTVNREFAGSQESQIASAWLRRLDILKSRAKAISKIVQFMKEEQDGTARMEELKLKLAMAYFSSYRFDDAKKLLMELSKSTNHEVSQMAAFYLGWLLKIGAKYDESAKVLEDLLDNASLDKELQLGIKAQLADVYYLKKDTKKSLEKYEEISAESQELPSGSEIAKEVWASLSELEQASIYYFSLGNSDKGRQHLDLLNEIADIPDELGIEEDNLSDISRLSLRDRAFDALSSGRIHSAYDLFLKNEIYEPGDAWTYSGLATVYLLFGNIDQAVEYANRGYEERSDEYTISVLGYVNSYLKNDESTVQMYRAALERNKNYVPARFNLAVIYLGSQKFREAYELLDVLEKSLSARETFMRSKVLNNIGYALWGLGRKSDSKLKFQEALKITPKFATAQQNLDKLESGSALEIVSLNKE